MTYELNITGEVLVENTGDIDTIEAGGDTEHIGEIENIEEFTKPLELKGPHTFKYDYPMDKPAQFEHNLKRYMTPCDLLRLAVADYAAIYAHSERYGDFMHPVEDLAFEGIKVDGNVVTFDIGS